MRRWGPWIALALLAPVAVLLSLTVRWFDYADLRSAPPTAARGEAGDFGIGTARLDELEVIEGDRIGAPEGTDLVVATLTIDPATAEGVYCSVVLVAPSPRGERRWDADPYPPADFRVPDDLESSCSSDADAEFRMQTAFLVPRGGAADAAIEITSVGRSLLRLE